MHFNCKYTATASANFIRGIPDELEQKMSNKNQPRKFASISIIHLFYLFNTIMVCEKLSKK